MQAPQIRVEIMQRDNRTRENARKTIENAIQKEKHNEKNSND